MIIDNNSAFRFEGKNYNVCIIGAGAAGITIALELATDKNIKIAVLEAGGEHFDHQVQSLYRGETEGDERTPLWRTRYSALGGSTQIWAGWCRPLEPFDFTRREYLKNSGWPIDSETLTEPYLRANEICGLGNYSYQLSDWQSLFPGSTLPVEDDVVHHVFQVRRLQFNKQYCETLQNANNIDLYLRSPVMRLHAEVQNDKKYVDHVKVASYSGSISTMKADRFVLATGGIENARLLLLSADTPQQALGNQNDCVGRYFMEHGFTDAGWFIPSAEYRDMSYYFPVSHPFDNDSASVRQVLTLAPSVIQKEQLPSAAMFFYPGYEGHTVFEKKAVQQALELWEIVKRKSAKELYEIARTEGAMSDFWQYSRQIASHPLQVLQAISRKILIKGYSHKQWRIRYYFESAPNRENRVMLSNRKDRFGRPQAKLIWHLSDEDIENAIRFIRYLDNALQRTGAGRLNVDNTLSQWRAMTETGKHPSGATRMHQDPKQGVVDSDCKVHGVENLYIAGSSVFPTIGYTNPTLTIVALAVRLADLLRRNVQD